MRLGFPFPLEEPSSRSIYCESNRQHPETERYLLCSIGIIIELQLIVDHIQDVVIHRALHLFRNRTQGLVLNGLLQQNVSAGWIVLRWKDDLRLRTDIDEIGEQLSNSRVQWKRKRKSIPHCRDLLIGDFHSNELLDAVEVALVEMEDSLQGRKRNRIERTEKKKKVKKKSELPESNQRPLDCCNAATTV